MERLLVERISEMLKIAEPEKMGLFTGCTGVCLALYMLARKSGSPDAEKLADGLMEKISRNIRKVEDVCFDSGLAGIGWAVSVLAEYGCVEGDVDDILYEIDAAIYKVLTVENMEIPLDCTKGLVGYLIYYVARLSNPRHSHSGLLDRLDKAALRIVIDRIEKTAPSTFMSVSKDLYISALWEIPIMLVLLRKTMELGVYEHKIESMVRNWEIYIRGNIPYYDINKLMLAGALAYLNERLNSAFVGKQIDLLVCSVDFDNIEKEIDSRIESINEGWFLAAYVLLQAERHISSGNVIYNRISKARQMITDTHLARTVRRLEAPESKFDISLVNGLAGMAFLYALSPEIFQRNTIL